jgi:uncharacterized protein (TIGR03067 family)
MHVSRCLLFVSTVFGLSILSSVTHAEQQRADEELSGDLKALQGSWITKDDSGESTWKFEKDMLSLEVPGRSYKIKIKLDEKAEPHKHIDMDVLEDSPNAKGFKAPGIYKIDGDSLTICFTSDGTRPEKFEGDFMTTFLFESKKKKD